jgi:hypothetical protein
MALVLKAGMAKLSRMALIASAMSCAESTKVPSKSKAITCMSPAVQGWVADVRLVCVVMLFPYFLSIYPARLAATFLQPFGK